MSYYTYCTTTNYSLRGISYSNAGNVMWSLNGRCIATKGARIIGDFEASEKSCVRGSAY